MHPPTVPASPAADKSRATHVETACVWCVRDACGLPSGRPWLAPCITLAERWKQVLQAGFFVRSPR